VFEFLLIVTLTLGPAKVERLYYVSSQRFAERHVCIAKGKQSGDALIYALNRAKPKLKVKATVGCTEAEWNDA
jgi:hypothetical protein